MTLFTAAYQLDRADPVSRRIWVEVSPSDRVSVKHSNFSVQAMSSWSGDWTASAARFNTFSKPLPTSSSARSAAGSCWPGGLALFVPDQVQETFQPSTDHGGTDGAGRALLYLEWSYDPDEHATMYTVEYAQVLREGMKPVRFDPKRIPVGYSHARNGY